MAEPSLIETGVDKLVSLVRKNKKISVANAARQLGVSTVVVEEWADFLEEEGIISLEYKFTTPYLIERVLSKEEIVKKEKEFGGRKEAFVRKAEVALALLDKESEAFQKMRQQFDDLKKDLGSEIKHVKGDLKELEKYEALKNKLGVEISEQQKLFKEKIAQIESTIAQDERRYADLFNKIGEEQQKLDKEKMLALSIRERENVLRQKLDGFRQMIEKIEASIESEDKLIVDSEEHIASLKEITNEIQENVRARKAVLDKIFDESRNKEKEICEMHESILRKAKAKKEEIEKRIAEGKGASRKFNEFFEKKGKIEVLMSRISAERNALEKEFINLIHKAKAFSIVKKSSNISSHISELKKTFKKVDKKKGIFEKEIRKLSSLLKS